MNKSSIFKKLVTKTAQAASFIALKAQICI
jgi:hypothetical protein